MPIRTCLIYLRGLRAPFFTVTWIPVLLGGVVGFKEVGTLSESILILCLLTGFFLHLAMNMTHNYFAHLHGVSKSHPEFTCPFTGGTHRIEDPFLKPQEVYRGALSCFAISILLGIILAISTGWGLLLIGAVGLSLAYFYSAPPLQLSHRGLGEVGVGVNFGLLATVGSYYAQTQKVSAEGIWLGLSLAPLTMAILFIHQFPDAESNQSVGKRDWVVRLGKPRAARLFRWFFWLCYNWIALGVIAGVLTPWALVTLLSVPFSFKTIRMVENRFANTSELLAASRAVLTVFLAIGLLLIIAYLMEGLS